MRTFSKATIQRVLFLAACYIYELPLGCTYYLDAMDDEAVVLEIEIDNELHWRMVGELLGVAKGHEEPEILKYLGGGALIVNAYMKPMEEPPNEAA